MADEVTGIAQALSAFWGGAVTSIFGAGVGMMAYHGTEVSKKRRKFFGPELLWAPFVAVFMALIGEAIGDYFDLDRQVMTGVIAVLGWLGPRGVQHFAEAWIARKGGGE